MGNRHQKRLSGKHRREWFRLLIQNGAENAAFFFFWISLPSLSTRNPESVQGSAGNKFVILSLAMSWSSPSENRTCCILLATSASILKAAVWRVLQNINNMLVSFHHIFVYHHAEDDITLKSAMHKDMKTQTAKQYYRTWVLYHGKHFSAICYDRSLLQEQLTK